MKANVSTWIWRRRQSMSVNLIKCLDNSDDCLVIIDMIGMISMKFPLVTYICVVGDWFTTKAVSWNDLQWRFCSEHHSVAIGANLTSLVSKKRREGDSKKGEIVFAPYRLPSRTCSTHFRCWGKTGNEFWLGRNEIQPAQRNQLLATPKILFAFKSCPFLRLISIFTRGFLGYALSSFYLGPSGEYFSGPDRTKNQFVDFVLGLIFRAN